nr:hypothetical protein [Tanacetum cinerariifolium]
VAVNMVVSMVVLVWRGRRRLGDVDDGEGDEGDDIDGGMEVLVRWQWWRGVCCDGRRRWPETHRSGAGKVERREEC